MSENYLKRIIRKILILLFKISGLIPLTYNRRNKNYGQNGACHYHLSSASIAYNFILIGIVVGLYFGTSAKDPYYFRDIINEKPVAGMENAGAGSIAIMLWLTFILNRNNAAATLDIFFDLEDLLQKRYWSHWSKRNETKCVRTIVINIMVVALVCWFSFKIEDIPMTMSILYFTSKLLITVCLLKYSLMCIMIEDMVHCLNMILSEFHTTAVYPDRIIDDLKNVRSLYYVVWDIREKVNDFFGIPMLTIVTYVSFGLICTVSMIVTVAKRAQFLLAGPNQPFYVIQFAVIIATCVLFGTTTGAVKEVRTQKLVIVLNSMKLTVTIICWASLVQEDRTCSSQGV